MRTRLLIATAVSMFVIGAATLTVNYTSVFSAFAQDAEAGHSAEAIPASMETVTEETVVSEEAADVIEEAAEVAAEATEASDTANAEPVAHEDHAEQAETTEEVETESTPEN